MINNGIFSQQAYEERIHQTTGLIHEADAILIGAGAGLSTAAGLQYGGKRFKENFGEFIQKYGAYYMTDMYSAGFYPYPSEEAKWGYWSKHALMNRFEISALPLYKQLYDIVRQKNYFVITTNVDYQFYKAGFWKRTFLRHKAIMAKYSAGKGVILKPMKQRGYFEKWMQRGGIALFHQNLCQNVLFVAVGWL